MFFPSMPVRWNELATANETFNRLTLSFWPRQPFLMIRNSICRLSANLSAIIRTANYFLAYLILDWRKRLAANVTVAIHFIVTSKSAS